MDKTAIVLLNYNGLNHLKSFIPDLVKHSGDAVIYLADNASSDNSAEWVRDQYPQIKIIVLDRNYGFSGGYNRALARIEASYYILLNTDVRVTPNWLEPMVDLLDHSPEIAACQPKILSLLEPEKFEYAGAAGGFIDFLGYAFCRGRIFNTLEKDEGQYNKSCRIFWATGACMMIRSEVFHRLNGFDDDFFAHMEEIDLCWRLNRMGYLVYYHGESEVFHLGGGTLPKNNPKKTYLNFRNSLSMLYKNEAKNNLLWKLPLRLSLDYVAALRYLFYFNLKNFFSIFTAHFDFYNSLKNTRKKKQLMKIPVEQELALPIYQKSIVWDYFLNGRKKFSQLKFKI